MKIKKFMRYAAFLTGAAVCAGAGGTGYFYQRTMKRRHTGKTRTLKMSGTDWRQHRSLIEERKAFMLAQPHEDVYILSGDRLRLHGTYFPETYTEPGAEPAEEADTVKVVICFHGYTTAGMTSSHIALSDYYLRHGYRMLFVDERAHGESEGEYIGFGCLDRYDALKWSRWVIDREGDDVEILLHGTSMGGATVLMASGLQLPRQVKGIVSDCAFTSPKDVFTHVLHSVYHLPAFPMIPLSNQINKLRAGYGLDECNAAREVRKAHIPILLIHGDADTFVPSGMCDEIYENCASRKSRLVVKGAAHAESYYKDTGAYEQALDQFTAGL